MAFSKEYQKWVLDDVKTYRGLCRPVPSSLWKRMFVHKLPIKALHPNPEDEFCDPDIGPNEGIVSNYMITINRNIKHGNPPIQEKLTVEKMSTGGYMLLNGHHRWMAAVKCNLPTLPVEIVNAVSQADVMSRLHQSDKRICVSFDLDEVLLVSKDNKMANHRLPFPYNFLFKQNLRKNAGALISDLHQLGLDVWVYSGSNFAEEDIRKIMSLNQTHVTGVINCMKTRKSGQTLKQAFRDKYALSIHVDGSSILWVNTKAKTYGNISIESDERWAADALAKISTLEELKKLMED